MAGRIIARRLSLALSLMAILVLATTWTTALAEAPLAAAVDQNTFSLVDTITQEHIVFDNPSRQLEEQDGGDEGGEGNEGGEDGGDGDETGDDKKMEDTEKTKNPDGGGKEKIGDDDGNATDGNATDDGKDKNGGGDPKNSQSDAVDLADEEDPGGGTGGATEEIEESGPNATPGKGDGDTGETEKPGKPDDAGESGGGNNKITDDEKGGTNEDTNEDKGNGEDNNNEKNTPADGGSDANDTPTDKGDDGKADTPAKVTKSEYEDGNGVVYFLLVVLIGLCAAGYKNKDKIEPKIKELIETVSKEFEPDGRSGGGGFSVSKTTKYEQVASEETNDEEWGWGDDNGNATNDDDDDWGDDDWGDDMGTAGKKDIEMTTPAFSSNNSYDDTNMVQRRPSSGDEDEARRPVTKSTPVKTMSLGSKSTSGGRSNGMRLGTSPAMTPSTMSKKHTPAKPPAPSMAATNLPQDMPGTIGGMAMGITSLGPKKKPAAAAKPKKKKLLGATDDDLFASMGFGGPPAASKPKPKPKPTTLPSKFASPPAASSKPTTIAGSGSRWATQATPSPLAASTTFAKPAPPKPASTLGVASAAPAVVNPFASTSAPAPALIPDGFGDDDLDLGDDDLDLGGDDLGLGTADSAGAGGDDDWGDDDGDLDDLLFD